MDKNFDAYWAAIKPMTKKDQAWYTYNARQDDLRMNAELHVYVFKLKDQLNAAGIEPITFDEILTELYDEE